MTASVANLHYAPDTATGARKYLPKYFSGSIGNECLYCRLFGLIPAPSELDHDSETIKVVKTREFFFFKFLSISSCLSTTIKRAIFVSYILYVRIYIEISETALPNDFVKI